MLDKSTTGFHYFIERLSAEVPSQVLPTCKNCTIGARDQYFWTIRGREPGRSMGQISRTVEEVPHHRLTRWMQVHTFYNGLRNVTRTVINASIEGALMKKTTDEAYEILEDAATNTNQWPRDKITPVKAIGGIDNEVLINLVTHVAQLTKQLTRQ